MCLKLHLLKYSFHCALLIVANSVAGLLSFLPSVMITEHLEMHVYQPIAKAAKL